MSKADDLARSAYAAGFRGNDLLNITAIGLAESGGDPTQTGKAGEAGVWQIHPVHFGTITEAAARVDDEAAKFAAALTYGGTYEGKTVQKQGFSAWSVWLDKSYQRFIPDAAGALQTLYLEGHTDVTSPESKVPGVQPGSVSATTAGGGASILGVAIPDFAGGFDSVGGFLKAISARGFWPKVGLTLAAGMMIAWGVMIYAQKVPAVRETEQAVVNAAKPEA